ncbi:hypothetical protein LSH36_147g04040 [Paralvinella palmiformis]|uniref:Nucleolar protein 6 n=1 Tax=Paralvinella palmiformis TaxID=53620 RepID=A0AAD9JV57_9ANNE|nr:hypothetical protein LSH36_147g04040 [Paralvinella palmiformis]
MVIADSMSRNKKAVRLNEALKLTTNSKEKELAESEDGTISEEDEADDSLTSNDPEEEEGDPTGEDDGGPPSKKLKLSKSDLYKTPTNEEMSQLKETENLFQSSLFRLQITEMLAEVTLKDKKKNAINDFIAKLTAFLMGLKKGAPHEVLTCNSNSGCPEPGKTGENNPGKIQGNCK